MSCIIKIFNFKEGIKEEVQQYWEKKMKNWGIKTGTSLFLDQGALYAITRDFFVTQLSEDQRKGLYALVEDDKYLNKDTPEDYGQVGILGKFNSPAEADHQFNAYLRYLVQENKDKKKITYYEHLLFFGEFINTQEGATQTT